MTQAARQHHGTKQSDAEYFRQLADQWCEETGGMSFLSKRIAHPAYHKIMAMGRDALPFLFGELRDNPDYWFWALHCITREDPVRPGATFDQTVADWLTRAGHTATSTDVLSRVHWSNLTEEERVGTSPRSNDYNCIAWAAGEDHRWWESDDPRYDPHIGPKYWPAGVPHRFTVENCVQVFVQLGYTECESPEQEPSFEKVAIYADGDGEPTHVARQLPSGIWTSKMGALEDTDHATVRSVEGGMYGTAARFLRRPSP